MSSTVIKIENLYKEYKLGVISHGTLTHDLQSWWARIRGKEDPNSLISRSHRADAEKDSFLALKDVSFEVKQGERIGIIGQNGAGKSTLLKIISKITSPTKGQIKIKGRVGSLLEVGTGFHPELTGRENIYLNGAIMGMSRKEIDRKLDEIIDFAGVEKHIDTPVKRYSSGMNVRLGFAVAAHLEPEILLVDEVLAVGDAEFQKKAIGKMEDVSNSEGRTVLFVSHNMAAVSKLCTSALLLNDGKIECSGNIDDVINVYLHQKDKTSIRSKHGIGGILIRDLQIKNSIGRYSDVFRTFENITLELLCEATRDFQDASFAVCFNNTYNSRITSLWSSYTGDSFNIKEGMFKIVFNVNGIKLIPGDYDLIAYVEANGLEIDRIDYLKSISIEYTEKYGITVEPRLSQGVYMEDFNVSCENHIK